MPKLCPALSQHLPGATTPQSQRWDIQGMESGCAEEDEEREKEKEKGR